MRYRDVWKKKMQNNGGSESDSRLNSSKNLIVRNFKNDSSYKRAKLTKADLTKEEIDIRIKNVDRTTAQKRIIFLPDTVIDVGSYIEYDNRYYLITEFQDENVLAPYSTAKFCIQTINFKGLENPIPCACEDTAYNDKGEISVDYFSMVDGKIAIYVPVNKDTVKISQNMRFIFNHDKDAVFEVISMKNVSTPNIYKIVMKKVEYFEGKDDLENNIAYNEKFVDSGEDVPVVTDGYVISSSLNTFDIRQYSSPTFTVLKNGVADTDTWAITIGYNGVLTTHITVDSITANSIRIKNPKGANVNKLILNFVKGDIKISQEVGLVK